MASGGRDAGSDWTVDDEGKVSFSKMQIATTSNPLK